MAAEEKAEARSVGDRSASRSLKLSLIGHLFWIVPLIDDDRFFRIGNQGFSELVPLIGVPVTIYGMLYGVRGLKGAKAGLAVAGLVLSVIALIVCVACVLALPGPLQPFLGL